MKIKNLFLRVVVEGNMKILIVVGARPNFMKVAPIIRELDAVGVHYKLIHTGQHYDYNMSDVFFENLGIRKPDINFNTGPGNHASQTAYIMKMFDDICLVENPGMVIVIGDVNSTMACALVVSKLHGVLLAHVEAGERSFDRTMPEEINRVVTDVLSDYLFCATEKAKQNLLSEGIDENKIFVVGNVMVDSLLHCLPNINPHIKSKHVLATIHRASNTDNKVNLEIILSALHDISKKITVIFPLHPRTKKRIEKFRLYKYLNGITVVEPYDYFEFVKCMMKSLVVITDSGGIQVETTVLDVPCITVRENTEWGFTITEGTNILVGVNKDRITKEVFKVLNGDSKHTKLANENSRLLNGRVSERIIKVLICR
jgi:UDP-N-acetylglucosamine 2-epimerase (non-hydrolysing)